MKNKFRILSLLTAIFYFFSIIVSPQRVYASDGGAWFTGGTPMAGTTNPAATPPDLEKPQEPKCNPSPAPQTDPVYLHSGQFYYECTDLAIPGRGMDVVINHHYRSSSQNNGQFGFGWTINYFERLVRTATGSTILIDGSGRKDEYTFNATNNSYISPFGFYETLVQNTNGTWTKTNVNGMKKNYDVNGNLSSIVDRNGNTISFTYDSAGLLPINGVSSFQQTPGAQVLLAFDFQLKQITDTVGRNINFNYDNNGRLVSIVDYAGRTVSYTYDSNTNDLLSITKQATAQFPNGVTKTFAYNASHDLISITDARGQIFVTNTYDINRRVATQTLGAGTFTFTYSANQTVIADRNGNISTYNFNTAGNITRVENFTRGLRSNDPASFITVYTYNSDGMKVSETFPAGNGVVYLYDSANPDFRRRGNLLEVRRKTNMALANNNTNDIVLTVSYDPMFNQLQAVTDPKGNITTYTYDYQLTATDPNYGVKGNLIRVEMPAASTGNPRPTTTMKYNFYGQPIEVTDPNGNVSQYAYDLATGYLISVVRDTGVNHINATTNVSYDNVGNVVSITDPNNHTSTFLYNELNWLLEKTNALGFKAKYTYDANGNVTKVERQASTTAPIVWQTTQFFYNTLNNVASVTDPLNRVTSFGYDSNQNRTTVTDALSRVTTTAYDERDLPLSTTDANSPVGITKFDYTVNGNLKKITDANNNPTNYFYDGFDRQTSMSYANSLSQTYSYDKNSNLTNKLLSDGHNIVYVYDNLNRLMAKNYPQNGLGVNSTFSYDLGSRLLTANNLVSHITFGYDALNRVVAETQNLAPYLPGGGYTYSVGSGYDAAGNRTLLNYPIGFGIDFSFDVVDRLQNIGVGGFNFVGYNYDTLNRPLQRNVYGGATLRAEYSFDIANQLNNVTNSIVGVAGIERTYAYDAVGKRTAKTESIPGLLGPVPTGYAYNSIDELTNITGVQGILNPVSAAHNFSYDNVGNRLNVDGFNVTHNNVNQYVQAGPYALTHDVNGNTTFNGSSNFIYDEENRLIFATNLQGATTYLYDAFNRRIGKTTGTSATYYVHDGDRIIEERDSAGNFAASFLYGNGIDEILFMYRPGMPVGSGFYVYGQDGLGSVTEIFDFVSGLPVETYTYDVFGLPSVTNSVVGNPFMFTGRQWDPETTTYQYRARQYDPTLGRFLQRDPLGYAAGDINLYRYVGNNPVNFVDPLGLAGWNPMLDIADRAAGIGQKYTPTPTDRGDGTGNCHGEIWPQIKDDNNYLLMFLNAMLPKMNKNAPSWFGNPNVPKPTSNPYDQLKAQNDYWSGQMAGQIYNDNQRIQQLKENMGGGFSVYRWKGMEPIHGPFLD